MTHRPTVISIASGKGGVGKSVISSNLALQFSRQGKKVVLIDLDIGGANLHVLFGNLSPTRTLSDFLERRVETLGCLVHPISWAPGLGYIPGTENTLVAGNLLHSKKLRLLRHIRNLDADLVILDCAPGTSYHTLDFFLSADWHVAIATPDPTSVIEVYRFIKLAAIRKVITELSIRIHGEVRQALVNREFSSIQDVLKAFGQTEGLQKTEAFGILRTFAPSLIVNRISKKSKFSTASLQQVLLKFLGTDLVVLGEIPQDSQVEDSVREFLPVLDFAPHSHASLALRQTFYALEQRLPKPTYLAASA
ncbi:MAG: P-loop NTPase [Nitrospirales bacterium]|nr:P-loop NTPase [Nitrospira sp.]MDR4499922.1 P-loop NTPase [Nitrospirales bacterium]